MAFVRNKGKIVKVVAGGVVVIVVVGVVVGIASKLKSAITGDAPEGFVAITTGMHTTESITQVSAQTSAQIAVLSNQYQAQMAAYNAKFAELQQKENDLVTLKQARVGKATKLNTDQDTVDQLDRQCQSQQASIDSLQQDYNRQGTDVFGILASIVTLGIGPSVIRGDIQSQITTATTTLNSLRAQLATAITTRDAASKALTKIDSDIAAIEEILGNYAAAFDAIGRVRDGLALEITQLGGSVPN